MKIERERQKQRDSVCVYVYMCEREIVRTPLFLISYSRLTGSCTRRVWLAAPAPIHNKYTS
jgi:transcription antitermination factor NusA-like protein